jgi:putative flippase GtrA
LIEKVLERVGNAVIEGVPKTIDAAGEYASDDANRIVVYMLVFMASFFGVHALGYTLGFSLAFVVYAFRMYREKTLDLIIDGLIVFGVGYATKVLFSDFPLREYTIATIVFVVASFIIQYIGKRAKIENIINDPFQAIA